MSSDLDTSIPMQQQENLISPSDADPQPPAQVQQVYVQQASPQPKPVYVLHPLSPQQQIYVQQPPQQQQNQVPLTQVQEINPSTQQPQQQYIPVTLNANPPQTTVQVAPQQNVGMFQNQINQLPLIGEDQQVTVEKSLTFSIKWSNSVLIKFLVDLFIFSRFLAYQYGLFIYMFGSYSVFYTAYTSLIKWFNVLMCTFFIWANLGCGYSYKNSPTLKRFHYIMLVLSIFEAIKFIFHNGTTRYLYYSFEIIYDSYSKAELYLIALMVQKVIASIV